MSLLFVFAGKCKVGRTSMGVAISEESNAFGRVIVLETESGWVTRGQQEVSVISSGLAEVTDFILSTHPLHFTSIVSLCIYCYFSPNTLIPLWEHPLPLENISPVFTGISP